MKQVNYPEMTALSLLKHKSLHQQRANLGMRFEEQMRSVENMRLHPRQILQPRARLLEREEGVVATPEHQSGRLMRLEISRNRIEPFHMMLVVADQVLLEIEPARQRHHVPVLFPFLR